MSDAPLLRIDRLELTNYRCFERFELKLHPRCTVLIGENASGKTTLVDALTAAWKLPLVRGEDVEVLAGVTDPRRVAVSTAGLPDYEPCFPCILKARGRLLEGSEELWQAELHGPFAEAKTYYSSPGRVDALFRGEGNSGPGGPLRLPLVARYSTDRAWMARGTLKDEPELNSRLDAYRDAEDPTVSFDDVESWIRRKTYAELQKRTTSPQLEAVRAAVLKMIPDAERFFFDIERDQITIQLRGHPPVSLEQQSDGYRSVIALVADLAWRAVVLNPQDGAEAPQKASGIAIIDEVGLHLHPRWQYRVLGDLLRIFPGVQFVVTTHSPGVIASCEPEWVRGLVVGEEQARRVDATRGKDVNSILRDVMGVSARPPDWERALDELAAQIEDGDLEAARRQLDEVRRSLGPDDPTVIGLEWELHDQEVHRGDDGADG